MERRVARMNIEHFERLLLAETDLGRRLRIEQLLDEERNKLAGLESRADDLRQGPPDARMQRTALR